MRLALVILALSLFSCSYEKRLKKWCARCVDSTNINTIVSEIKSDTTLHIDSIVGETINLQFGDDCDSIKMVLDELRKNPIIVIKNGIKTIVKFDDKRVLEIQSVLQARDIELKDAIRKYTIYRREFERLVKQEVCKREHKNKFDGFTFWWFIFTAIITALYLVFKYIRR